MLFFKIAGAALLIGSGALGAHILNRSAARALSQSEAISSLLRTVRASVECFSLALPSILASCEKEQLAACGYTEKEAPQDLHALLRACTVYDRESVAILSRFAEQFGKGYREEQIALCSYYLTQTEARQRVLSEALPLTRRRNTTLCLSAAIALALLLL